MKNSKTSPGALVYGKRERSYRFWHCIRSWARRLCVVSLSTRQSQILEILASSQGDIVSREDILNNVWGDDSYANSLALNVQISYLRRILSLDPSVEILSIKKRGYTLKIK